MFALGEALDDPPGDLPGIGGLLPGRDRREFRRQRPFRPARAAVPQILDRVQADGADDSGQEASCYRGERGEAVLSVAHVNHRSSLEKICRKNRKTFSTSRKIEAASSGAAVMSALVRSRWKSNMVNPAKITRPSTE